MTTSTPAPLWALVLAGGDGTRLQPLTRLITGAPIPKQYCRLLGERSLLEETLARIAPLVPAARTLAVVNSNHLPLASTQLSPLPARNVIVQPQNRDTGPGLLLPLLALARRAPDATVAVFPSDHYVADPAAFRGYVRRAADLVARDPDRIALLGTNPEWADPGYGYILPGTRVGSDAFTVRAFCEKPQPALAEQVVARGALWNCFVMVCRVDRLLALATALRPRDVAALAVATTRGGDCSALGTTYADLAAWNFSHDVLAHVTADLLVVRARGIGWSDWGTVGAIERTLATLGRTPPWRSGDRLAATA
ncbi:MAG TPA: sugar phosphate nucleotidyltransferase [Candidatus Binatia bacterium]|jgi:mannose-1-phosphate guanylyltransferase